MIELIIKKRPGEFHEENTPRGEQLLAKPLPLFAPLFAGSPKNRLPSAYSKVPVSKNELYLLRRGLRWWKLAMIESIFSAVSASMMALCYLSRKNERFDVDGIMLKPASQVLRLPATIAKVVITGEHRKALHNVIYQVDAVDSQGHTRRVGTLMPRGLSGLIPFPVTVWFPAEQQAFPAAPRNNSEPAEATRVDKYGIGDYVSADGQLTVPMTISVRGVTFRASAPAVPRDVNGSWALSGIQKMELRP